MQEVKEKQGGLTFQIAGNQGVSAWKLGHKLQMWQEQVTLPYSSDCWQQNGNIKK